MTQDISGFGAVYRLIASNTFPSGFDITQFADDSDPLDMPSIKIGDSAVGVNGDLLFWRRAVAQPVTISVIPGSDDDINLGILASANRAGQGQAPVKDIVTLIIAYPDNAVVTLSQGGITDAMFGRSISSSGRMKSKPYVFIFQGLVGI